MKHFFFSLFSNYIFGPQASFSYNFHEGSFSIRPKTTAPVGTRLENFADIYFDFNNPIRTNTTVNTIWVPTLDPDLLDTVFVTASQRPIVPGSLSIHPNPSKGQVEIHNPEPGTIQIFDLRGTLKKNYTLRPGRNRLDFRILPKGMYVLKLQSEDEISVQKLILE